MYLSEYKNIIHGNGLIGNYITFEKNQKFTPIEELIATNVESNYQLNAFTWPHFPRKMNPACWNKRGNLNISQKTFKMNIKINNIL
jgi:hypothetical protein